MHLLRPRLPPRPSWNRPECFALHCAAKAAVAAAEAFEGISPPPGVSTRSGGAGSTPGLTPSSTLSDSWLNISRKGHWNRMHTHEGSAFACVYYVDDADVDAHARPYSGHFVVQPEVDPPRKLDKWEHTSAELRRMGVAGGGSGGGGGGGGGGAEAAGGGGQAAGTAGGSGCGQARDDGCCKYAQIKPRGGTMLLFPGWLLHCVLPVYLSDGEQADRISIAFNYEPAQ
jgi:hypothetical protein